MVQAQTEPYNGSFIDYFSPMTSVTGLLKSLLPLYDWRDEPSIIVKNVKRDEIIEYLKQNYEFIDPATIKVFLFDNPFLIDILLEAIGKIDSLFGVGAKKVLELFTDSEEGFEELFIVIKTDFPVPEARRRFNNLIDAWFLDVIDKTQGLLNITTETR